MFSAQAAVGISGPSAHERVKKLEARGVIQRYSAVVAPDALAAALRALPAPGGERREVRVTP